jgi:hypothetical protein
MAEQLSGRITFANGAPAAGVQIRIFDRDPGGSDDDLTVQAGLSDANGRFSLSYDQQRATDTITITTNEPRAWNDWTLVARTRSFADPLDEYLPYLDLRYTLRGKLHTRQVALDASPIEIRLPDAPPVSGSFVPSTHGFKFVNLFPGIPLSISIPGLPDMSKIPASYGLCGGMSAAAADFFFAQRSIPETQEIPKKGTKLYQYLFRRQMDSFSPNGEPILRFMKWMKLDQQAAFGAWHRSMGEFERLKAMFDSGFPAHPIGLVFASPGEPLWENHQVLACGYTQKSTSLYEIKVYDPNFPWNDQVIIRAEVQNFEGSDSQGQERRLSTLRCARVAIVGDPETGKPIEQVRPMRGMFLMPYAPVAPPTGL